MIETFVLMALVGVAIGVLSGLIGVGGGTVMVPIFRLVLGLSPVSATGTSLLTIIPTSISGAVSHIRNKTCVPRAGIALGLGGACTSPLGVWLAQASPGWLVMGAAAVVIAYSGFTMLQKALRKPAARPATSSKDTSGTTSAPDAAGNTGAPGASHPVVAHPVHDEPVVRTDFTRGDLARFFAIGLLTGAVSGYVGLGGGFLMVPLMVSLLNFPMRFASGTSLIGIMIIAIPGAALQCFFGNVDYLAALAVACGSIPGAVLGARLASRVPERALRITFAAFLGVAAILMVLKEIGLFG